MKLKGELLDYMYEKIYLFQMVVYSLKTHFNIESTMAAESFYSFIDRSGGLNEDFEQTEIEALFDGWKASCPVPQPSDFKYYSTPLNNTLAHFYKIPLTVKEDEEKEDIISTISQGNDFQMILKLALSISCYHRLLCLWRKFHLREHVTASFDYSDKVTRKALKRFSIEARIVDQYEKSDDEDINEFLINSILYKGFAVWFRKFLSLYYGKGYSFDENNMSERAFALQEFAMTGAIIEAKQDVLEEILARIAYPGIKTDDEFFNAQVFLLSNNISSERKSTDTIIAGPTIIPKVAGRKPGCWLVSDNLNEEAIWREVIQSSIWNNIMNELATFEFPGFTPKKIQSAQILLAAAMIYRGAEEKGIAKSFDNGVRQSFKRTLSFVKFNEDMLPDYMRLLNTWRSIQKKRHEMSTLSNDQLVMEDFESRETGRMIKAAFEKEIYLQYERTDPQLCRVLKVNSDKIGKVLSLIKKKLERGAYLSHTPKEEVDE